MRSRRECFPHLLAAALLVLPAAASARPRPVQLSYSAGEIPGCPDEEMLRGSVAAHLGYDPFGPAAETSAAAVITRSGPTLRARIELRGADGRLTGSRLLTARHGDCGELASAVALALAMAIDPAVRAHPGQQPAPVQQQQPQCPRCPPPSPAPQVQCPPPAPAPAQRRRPQLRIAASVLGSFGSAPGPAVGATAQVGLRLSWFSLGLEGRADLPAPLAASGPRVESSLLLASLVPCFHVRGLLFCALVSAGVLRGAAVQTAMPRSGVSPWVALGARAAYELHIYRALSLRAHVDVQAGVIPAALQIDGADVWTTPPLSAAVGLGAVGAF